MDKPKTVHWTERRRWCPAALIDERGGAVYRVMYGGRVLHPANALPHVAAADAAIKRMMQP